MYTMHLEPCLGPMHAPCMCHAGRVELDLDFMGAAAIELKDAANPGQLVSQLATMRGVADVEIDPPRFPAQSSSTCPLSGELNEPIGNECC